MPVAVPPLDRHVPWQVALALTGATAFCLYSHCWSDAAHLIYDIPASLLVFSFVAQLVLESHRAGSLFWLARLALVAIVSVSTVGRAFLHWPISGHLTCVFAVALVQSADPRLAVLERLLYWLPLPVVLSIRWWVFDLGQHGQTGWALLVGGAAALPAVVIARTARAIPSAHSELSP